MTVKHLFSSLLLILLASVPALGSVQLDAGAVEGVPDGDIVVYRGIPYAAPPIGDRRWRAPVPPEKWVGVRPAERYSATCIQRGSYPQDAPPEPMSEDCLYLNVWAPALASPGAKLPVLVWIHGGGLLSGSGSVPLYAGDQLARRGVVVVTLNYRLGAFGFLSHPGLSRESGAGTSGNYGVLDQIAALAWVNRNIGAFGGDAANVTVFGQSSGSISISVLCASPLAKGLFRRAIGQSGALFEPVDIAPEFFPSGAERVGLAFAKRLGAKDVADLRRMPASRIGDAPFQPNPIIDGHLLRESPFDTYQSGRANSVDLLIGSNTGEGYEFLGGRTITAASLSDELRKDFPPFIVSMIGPPAPATDRDALDAFVAFEGRMRFGWDMLAWARLHAGSRAHGTYLYRFDTTPQGEPGPRHGVEMPYVFGHAPAHREWTGEDVGLSSAMMSYWTNFARTGNPNGTGLPEWPGFERAREVVLMIGTPVRAATVPDSAELGSIDLLYAAVRIVTRNLQILATVAVLAIGGLALLAWRLVTGRQAGSATGAAAQSES